MSDKNSQFAEKTEQIQCKERRRGEGNKKIKDRCERERQRRTRREQERYEGTQLEVKLFRLQIAQWLIHRCIQLEVTVKGHFQHFNNITQKLVLYPAVLALLASIWLLPYHVALTSSPSPSLCWKRGHRCWLDGWLLTGSTACGF